MERKRYVPQRNVLKRIVGQIALAVQREVQLYMKRAFRMACEMKGFESSWVQAEGDGCNNIFGISGGKEVVVIMSTSSVK
ncbi:hypothetical protein [Neptuniibacter sp.]|uniref:hypothetical protein n=1 Tax=Neptuniibacter sp. TaxID=1962643 RepID=UPI00261F5912|nr:hypothetical protein [Neptuniibacter sp.]MCP4595664.1 hypothetical protein [Neptuniibacter sp.]